MANCIELIPCPWCKKVPEFVYGPEDNRSITHRCVQAVTTFCMTPEAWNRRADDQERDCLRGLLERAKMGINWAIVRMQFLENELPVTSDSEHGIDNLQRAVADISSALSDTERGT